MVFGNKTVAVHLLRGALGFAALYGSLATIDRTLWPSLILLPIVLYSFKGCFMCWTLGLIETVVMAVHRRHERSDPMASDVVS